MNQGGNEMPTRTGMSVSRVDGELRLRVPPETETWEFVDQVAKLGLTGRTDYEIEYDHETGDETWILPVV